MMLVVARRLQLGAREGLAEHVQHVEWAEEGGGVGLPPLALLPPLLGGDRPLDGMVLGHQRVHLGADVGDGYGHILAHDAPVDPSRPGIVAPATVRASLPGHLCSPPCVVLHLSRVPRIPWLYRTRWLQSTFRSLD